MLSCAHLCIFFFFNDTATTEIYTLSLHDALPILPISRLRCSPCERLAASSSALSSSPTDASTPRALSMMSRKSAWWVSMRSEEHTSELQSRLHLVCRLLLEKKKKKTTLRLHATQF